MSGPGDGATELISSQRRSQPPEPLRLPQIWIVDDSQLQAEVARRALAARFETTVFHSATVALEQLALGIALPDVLVVDWHMPEMSGSDMCRFVRDKFDQARLPILILTVTDTREAVLEALAIGANDFVPKPFTDEELCARVGTLARASQLHARLVTAERALRVEAEFRERFIGMLAHDLRQPLNTIFMAAQLQESAPEKRKAFATMQLRAVQSMKKMIAELLDFTRNRPERGLPLERVSVDLARLAANSVEEIGVAHGTARLCLTSEGSCVGSWDPDRLRQVCSNLIGNAIEHSYPDTPISIAVRGTPDAVVLTVSNQGPPIADDVRSTLFEPFRRGGGKKSAGGVGLGLHIVSQIVRAHDGDLWVESDDSGTHFVVQLPTASAPPDAAK